MIHAIGLTKTFETRKGAVEAVRGVRIEVAEGEIVAFLGPNGAGKTTTMRLLTTLLKPTSGTATIAGHDLFADPTGVRRRIGYVAQGATVSPMGYVGEDLEVQARLYGLRPAEARARVREVLAQLDLTGVEQRVAGSLSGGQRRRVDIAMGLLHRPALLFLDEPTTGLDPQSRANLWGHIRRLRDDEGVTVFFSTHYLDEADALCDRVLIIDHGRIVTEGTPAQLKAGIGPDATLDDVFLTVTGRELREEAVA
ncbi:ATP-binding cassette domain-containing protein [Acrocarpospora macrocephala]|uniref:ABC transporter ATP-binding protein n=1 Tax=Acrocarpospora macrocephala TaxID=150177 RepID=A0A5M3X057_9ACTN|nr:ATP-binding cassette domain-containing protein [Acrocarpospora macrocephala]GES12981.1 ABC transporter ATP-binding protein [Acrocarpospora macrocephala]